MELQEIYRIKKGQVISENITIPFFFGIVYSDDGFIRLDLYVNEEYDLKALTNDSSREYWQSNYNLTCITEENNILIIDNLRFSQNNPHLSRIKMVSYGKMEHIKDKKKGFEESDFKPLIKYLVLEGLKIEFSDFTEEIRERGGQKIEDFNNLKRDHSTTNLVHKRFPYSQTYYKLSEDSDDIIVEFTEENSNRLTYELFLEIKHSYISALSFINGAEVRIRKECYGSYYTIGKIDAEKVVTYSFKKIDNRRYNSYIPINDPFHRGENVLGKFLMFNFDKFIKWCEKIDIKSIIFYLNNSEQTKSLEEKVFIQIIAFERLTTMYVEFLGDKEEFLPNKTDYNPIKKELNKIIDLNKDKFGNAYNTVKSKIGNLNQIKRHSTTDKMYRIINDFNIPITPKIEKLIDVVRHKTVHRGDIGEGQEGITTFYLLDELIREIILRMVEYKGKRKSRILLNE
ncbi:hypothetical protein ABMY20_09410 [Tenacibaculum sp. SSH1-16]|uniref:hypothetical protein n=1 Tax=unclassified Tenacibaculum TaxID=2635139 RepID=UPI0020972131|nr:hypothetical protein [Tenacibaculum sp. XPcli2-G]MCO7186104.1 hypothetical protein [Tenacibaculum sp. XPcli2-G]BFF36899.1 hypothetical protein BACT7_17610 [Tenacibaculum mesophilum]